MRQATCKQQRRQAMARRVLIEQMRQKWLEKPVLFTIPQGIGYGVVYLISDDGDVIVSHADYQETRLSPAFAFNIERLNVVLGHGTSKPCHYKYINSAIPGSVVWFVEGFKVTNRNPSKYRSSPFPLSFFTWFLVFFSSGRCFKLGV